MAERLIEDGFVDCPKYGIMDEQRCLPSCEYHESKNEACIVCLFGEAASAGKAPADKTSEETPAGQST